MENNNANYTFKSGMLYMLGMKTKPWLSENQSNQ